ncbi:phosphate-starvation-inducible E [bacterium BMS3Abin07]|nr:phosphate-starvation-inducible E [bacterium BMS3Abin07]GBE31665.1 phosphate-starvation-inducible E [bacterium BMS3Bbin05]HDO22718.1 heme-binding sensor globin domain-containing protein [Nitrospirota bacterium]HDZ88518.1 heme-binding sensor globin domain-containing protein [Nitrospirota bacterium]
MENLKTIFDHYNFSHDDVKRLKSILPLMEDYADDCVRFIHNHIRHLGNKDVSRLLDGHPQLLNYHREWLLDMFRGVFDKNYFNHLKRIGKVHTNEDVRPHYVNVSVNAVRAYIIDLLTEKIEDRDLRTSLKESVNKVLDINLDIVTSSYVEEEIQTLSAGYKIKTLLITFAEKFSSVMNLVLVLALIVITLGVVGLFVSDLVNLVRGNNISHGIITVLGSLLILWVMIELMNTEIAHLKGGKFNISVFIGVALVTFIRDLMINALKHDETSFQALSAYYPIGVIFILGIVYWLVVRAEGRRQ